MLYTIDTHHFIRGALTPGNKDIEAMIWKAGNVSFTHVGFSAMGMPLVECDEKPADSQLFGVRWIAAELIA